MNANDQNRPIIIADTWYTKWNAMTSLELEAEYESLLKNINLATNDAIYQQLSEVLQLFTEYKKQKDVKK